MQKNKKISEELKTEMHELHRDFHDLYPLHTPSNEEDRETGFGSVATEEEKADPVKATTEKKKLTPVFLFSLLIVAGLTAACLAWPSQFLAATSQLCDTISTDFGWFYLLLVALIVIVCMVFMISPIGNIHLGNPGDKPTFSRASWIAMLFSAGMGIGLVFWGAAEPLAHFATSTPGPEVGSVEALRDAFQYSFFHWGFSAWAVYGIVALALAYFRFRKKEKALFSVTLKPLFGKHATGPLGTAVDVLTVLATVIGVATSLGFGAMQINGGLNYLFGIPNNSTVQLIIIGITTVCFIASSLSGISRGVRWLSNANVILAVAFVLAALAIGPTAQTMNVLVTSTGDYLQNFISMSFNVAPFDQSHHDWIKSWTIFYWAWWISWSPFVGVFIARISRGRSIREFLLCVILIPTIFSCIWFAVFGSLTTAVQIGGVNLANLPTETVLYGALAHYDFGRVLSMVAVVLVFSFFITSADSASFVLGMLSENGNLEPRLRTKAIWGVLLSALTCVLLLSGGLGALQNVLIISALPFSFVIALLLVSLHKELQHERVQMGLFLRPLILPKADKPFRSYEDQKTLKPIEIIRKSVKADQTVMAFAKATAGMTTAERKEAVAVAEGVLAEMKSGEKKPSDASKSPKPETGKPAPAGTPGFIGPDTDDKGIVGVS